MRDHGFEALADATLLLTVLLVASGLALSLARPAVPSDLAAGPRYAEDLRLALFRTTMDGLGHRTADGFASMPNGTTVEAFLRAQVHLLAGGRPAADFRESNARILDLAVRLLRPGWGAAVTGRLLGGEDLVRIPEGVPIPATYDGSAWTYPPLDGSAADVRLAVAVWPTPPR